jgi:hypothetical protein
MHESNSASVFLGVPAVITRQQQSQLERWLSWLEEQALEVVRLKRSAYEANPWPKLTHLLTPVDGVVLLGFRQLDVHEAIWRPHTEEEERPAGWWTTPWLQLEAGMAIGLGLPVLVAPDEGVREGVFSPGAWSTQVHGTALSSPGEAALDWLELVRKHQIARTQSSR